MTEFESLSVQDRAETIRGLISLIDNQIKLFISDICKDVGFSYEQLYLKTDINHYSYSVHLYHAKNKHHMSHHWTIEQFLLMCQDRDKLETEMNVVIRKMVLELQYADHKGIVF